MPNIVDRFGQLVDDAIPKPELARQLLLLGYRAKDVQLLLAPEKELTPARQYAAQIAMDAMIAPLAHPQRAALGNIFMPCELLHAFHLLPMFAEATACYLNGAAAEALSIMPRAQASAPRCAVTTRLCWAWGFPARRASRCSLPAPPLPAMPTT